MNNKHIIILLLVSVLFAGNASGQKTKKHNYDICIYGGTSAGVIAAYTAAKLGKKVILIEPGRNLGGMSSGGLGLTDIGNKYAISGLALDFYRRIGQHYGKFEQWIFEPHVAEDLFRDYIKRADIEVIYGNRISALRKQGNVIQEVSLENSVTSMPANVVAAKMFIDCSYEGDLMARAGVSYSVGREDNKDFDETFNGVQLMTGHQLPDGIDPYRVPGNSNSGLLWGIGNSKLAAKGTGDKKVQAYNFRICLTNNASNLIPITQPEDYQPARYELLIRQMEKREWKSLQDVFIWSLMPNGKTDINNRNGFSTDMIGMNWDYPDADYRRRAEIWTAHVNYTKGLLYFVGNDPRVPEKVRNEMKTWGYPKDEYTRNGGWSHQLYIREARRMIGELVMTQHHCQGKEKVNDGIGMAAYTMDSHNCDRLVLDGAVKNEGNVEEGGFGPYPISYRSIIPKQSQAANLLVPVCLSATHIAYGSIRMEPVFMVLAQSAATAAVQAINNQQAVQQIDVQKLQAALKKDPLVDGQTAEILIDNDNADLVERKGKWNSEPRGGYGPDFYVSGQDRVGPQSVVYHAKLLKGGQYDVYTYYPKRNNTSSKTQIKVHDGKRLHAIALKDADVKVLGQTSGEWVKLGSYQFSAGKNGYVEISTEGADADVVADAVLFVPGSSTL